MVGLALDGPKNMAGRGYSLEEMVAYNEEYARYGGPGRSGHIGETLFAPTLIAFGSEEQKSNFYRGLEPGLNIGAKAIPSQMPAPIFPI